MKMGSVMGLVRSWFKHVSRDNTLTFWHFLLLLWDLTGTKFWCFFSLKAGRENWEKLGRTGLHNRQQRGIQEREGDPPEAACWQSWPGHGPTLADPSKWEELEPGEGGTSRPPRQRSTGVGAAKEGALVENRTGKEAPRHQRREWGQLNSLGNQSM